MADNLKPDDRRKTMQAVKGKATKLERRLASMLAGARLKGWKRNARDVTGTPDVVFPREKVAIFMDGCFWHGCPYCNRPLPVNNADYWVRKIQRNVERARVVNTRLEKNNWKVVRIWEHEMKTAESRKVAAKRIAEALV